MKINLTGYLFGVLMAATFCTYGQQKVKPKRYRLWYAQPAPDLPVINKDSLNKQALVEATPVDNSWENWSLPIGNGYLGASIFGRTRTERIQITENSMAAKSLYGGAGLTAFANLYIDFNHNQPLKYERSLNLADALSTVSYVQDGVTYKRQYFASYPDKVLVIKLTANRKSKLSFTLRPEIPYQKQWGAASNYNGRTGKVIAAKDVVTLSGKMEYVNLLFEGQFKVIPSGGKMKAFNDADNDNGKLVITDADSAIIIVAVGTNYKLRPDVFTENNYAKKLADNPPPHERVTQIIERAGARSYPQLLSDHLKDYKNLFSRVNFDLGSAESKLTTDKLLENYKKGLIDNYLEELYFRYGRYLLICSSRPGTLPPNLQGIWNQYDIAPWTGGYWHNINIQMNYWPVFNTNLTELFQSFADYNLAYRKSAEKIAAQYIKNNNPQQLSAISGENGWTIGTGANAYSIGAPGGHSGPGTGALTTKLFWDYYAFTGDVDILKKVSYPAILGMAKFLSKVVVDTAGLLLANPSYSPEQRWQIVKDHYQTAGCAFDQEMIYENHKDALSAAKILGDSGQALSFLKSQLTKLDPVQIGWSGQIKEYREEKYYGEIGDPHHRHISQLVGLYPGTIINSNTPAWLDAAKETLNGRGDQSTGWAMAHRLNLWARVKDGDRAYQLFQTLLKKGTLDNLWDTHPPFQIDGNFGGTAGVAEMLLQSHEGYIDLLPAIPQAWQSGTYSGLLARGNFEVSAQWNNGVATQFTIKSKNGGLCKLKYFNINRSVIKNLSGKSIVNVKRKRDFVEFDTKPGDVYAISQIPPYQKVGNPTNLKAIADRNGLISLNWQSGSANNKYNIYVLADNAPDYSVVKSNIKQTGITYQVPGRSLSKNYVFKVSAIDDTGRESTGIRINVVPDK